MGLQELHAACGAVDEGDELAVQQLVHAHVQTIAGASGGPPREERRLAVHRLHTRRFAGAHAHAVKMGALSLPVPEGPPQRAGGRLAV